MLVHPRAVPALLAALLILVLPASASAANFVVNSTADEPDAVAGGLCESAAGKCTLRAAIEVTNLTLAEKDTINFNATVFEGQLADTIEPATALPTIDVPLEINAGTCMTAAGVNGPCAGVKAPSGQNGLTVEADNTAIYDLAITNGSFGIDVINASTGFVARGNWVGVRLDGASVGNTTDGIFLDPGSDEATIGGTEVVQRNVISANGVGLDIEGASEATVQGNYFGVAPNGIAAMGNSKDIELTDSTSGGGFKAEGDEIGTTVSQGAIETAACDGGCNVISGATSIGVDLNGNGAGQNEAPASGPTFVRGNFIGVSSSGTIGIANGTDGIYAGGADKATIGGFPLGDANYISGGSEGIVSENGESFVVRGNRLGVGPSGVNLVRPGLGIFALDQAVSETANIEQNVVLAGGVGIEQRGVGGHVTGNEVKGGSVGIYQRGEPAGGLIASNLVEAPSEYGILVDGPNQEVRANTVIGSGAAGIRFRNPPGIAMTGGLIGGSTTEKENVIEGSGGPAIEILEEALEPGSVTEIARNRGSGNAGPFIDLVKGANEGILPPAFSLAQQSKAEGTAEPEAKIRVFRKASAEAGEIESFLAETVADSSGNWKVSYPAQIPTGTIVAATQTSTLGATSELATTTSAADPSNGGGGGGNSGGGGGGNGGGQGGTPDTTAPTVKITKGPKAKSTSTTAKFKFKANEAGSTFQCKLDKSKFKKCSSPKTYKKLKPGKHVFKVRATDKAGNVGPAAKRKFTVLP